MIIDINRNTLANLYEQFPENFKDLSLNGNDLVYGDESIDISQFNINDLLVGETQFSTSLSVLSSQDIFKIIRLHAILMQRTSKKENASESEKKVEIIKQENPLMKNISIVRKGTDVGETEFINIVDENGMDHLFKNDRNVDFFQLYETLKYRNMGAAVTPTQLITEINRKLYDIHLTEAKSLAEKDTTSEDFANKMHRVNDPYLDDKMHMVYGNETDDVAVVADVSSPSEHQVITFDENEFGDLVVENHAQNVSGTDTITGTSPSFETQTFESSVSNDVVSDIQVQEEEEEEVVAVLLATQEFYALLNSSEDLTEEQRKKVDLYYGYLGDLILYEDYLLPELRDILNQFRAYVYHLEYDEHEFGINAKQQEAVDKNHSLEEQKAITVDASDPSKVDAHVKKLQLLKPDNTGVSLPTEDESDNQGSISTLQVIAFIVGIAIILTAVTLYLIG